MTREYWPVPTGVVLYVENCAENADLLSLLKKVCLSPSASRHRDRLAGFQFYLTEEEFKSFKEQYHFQRIH